jgi:hypothetical protein
VSTADDDTVAGLRLATNQWQRETIGEVVLARNCKDTLLLWAERAGAGGGSAIIDADEAESLARMLLSWARRVRGQS